MARAITAEENRKLAQTGPSTTAELVNYSKECPEMPYHRYGNNNRRN